MKPMDIAILLFAKGYILEHGYPPSVREIAEGVGLKSTSSVQNHLQKLLETGAIETDADPGTPRAIRVPSLEVVQKRDKVICGECGEELYVRYRFCPWCGRER